jgi:hypothetical protein
MNDKLLRAFIEASGYEIEEVAPTITKERKEFLESENMLLTLAVEGTVDYKVTKKYSITKEMIDQIIDELGNHTVAGNGHNNDDVLDMIHNLEVLIDENI